ncbi:hypothetical protein MMC17_005083 [Xylographa soralifera]|nr:hypothetical protein [Xylographa soralifera]
MEDRAPSLIPETQSSPTSLDAEILQVRQQTLLSSPSSQTLLARAKAQPNPSPHITTFEKRMKEQQRQNVQNSYRMCAGATMFEARDPDPNAVDEGWIVGVRIEVFNRRSPSLRIHRHTIPQCIPLQHLGSKYLPSLVPSDGKPSGPQNIAHLVRDLRRELISYHLRQDAIVTLGERESIGADSEQQNGVKEVKSVDAENRDMRIEWEDGTVGRIAVDSRGNLEKVVVLNHERSRIRDKERSVLSAKTLGKLAQTLV